jgi:hypothetical protein
MTQRGYIARLRGLDHGSLRALIGAAVGEGHAFAGDLVTLEPPRPFSSQNLQDLALDYDFGYAYGRRAEVRWRREEDGSYDALILTEDAQYLPKDAQQLPGDWRVRATPKNVYVRQSEGKPVRLVEYLDGEYAAVAAFTRYAEVGS